MRRKPSGQTQVSKQFIVPKKREGEENYFNFVFREKN